MAGVQLVACGKVDGGEYRSMGGEVFGDEYALPSPVLCLANRAMSTCRTPASSVPLGSGVAAVRGAAQLLRLNSQALPSVR